MDGKKSGSVDAGGPGPAGPVLRDRSDGATRLDPAGDGDRARGEPPRGAIHAIGPEPDELERGEPGPELLQRAYEKFRLDGCLQLDRALPPETIVQLRDAYEARYCRYFEEKEHADALTVGQRRYMITVALERPFDDPALFANSFVLPVVRRALGPDCVLAGFGSVAALPGAPDQPGHRDFGFLFGNPMEPLLPAYAITLIIPLVDLGAEHGTTRMWKGSHGATNSQLKGLPFQEPATPVGSCLLMDYRLFHAGTANASARVRPILYIVYARPWFRDPINYTKQPALLVDRDQLARLRERFPELFALCGQPGPEAQAWT